MERMTIKLAKVGSPSLIVEITSTVASAYLGSDEQRQPIFLMSVTEYDAQSVFEKVLSIVASVALAEYFTTTFSDLSMAWNPCDGFELRANGESFSINIHIEGKLWPADGLHAIGTLGAYDKQSYENIVDSRGRLIDVLEPGLLCLFILNHVSAQRKESNERRNAQ